MIEGSFNKYKKDLRNKASKKLGIDIYEYDGEINKVSNTVFNTYTFLEIWNLATPFNGSSEGKRRVDERGVPISLETHSIEEMREYLKEPATPLNVLESLLEHEIGYSHVEFIIAIYTYEISQKVRYLIDAELDINCNDVMIEKHMPAFNPRYIKGDAKKIWLIFVNNSLFFSYVLMMINDLNDVEEKNKMVAIVEKYCQKNNVEIINDDKYLDIDYVMKSGLIRYEMIDDYTYVPEGHMSFNKLLKKNKTLKVDLSKLK